MRLPTHSPTLCLLATLLLSPDVWAEGISGVALDHTGQLRRALTGTYEELFTADDARASRPVLAVETLTPSGDVTRTLVPGTGDSRTETEPLLFQDPRADGFVVLWRSRAKGDGAQLRFATFDGTEWSDVFTLEREGTPVSLAGEFLIVDTRDAFELEIEEAAPIHLDRRVIHLLWQEGQESPRTYYAPLTLVGGSYVGWHRTFALADHFLLAPEARGDDAEGAAVDEDAEPVALTAALARTLQLWPATDGRSVLVTFANPSSQRIGTLEITPLPLELGLLGEQVQQQIFALADLYDPGDLSVFSDGMRAAIVIMGHLYRLHDAHAEYVADRVADWILSTEGAYGWGDLERLGADARDLTLDVGREVYASTAADPADPDSVIVRLDVSGLLEGLGEPDPTQILDFRTRADLPAPAIGDGAATVYASRTGDRLLIAWDEAATVDEGDPEAAGESATIRWIESRRGPGGAAWSEVFGLTPGDRLTVDQAHRVLAKRIR